MTLSTRGRCWCVLTAVLALVFAAGAVPTYAQSIVQTDWSGGSGTAASTALTTETGFDSATSGIDVTSTPGAVVLSGFVATDGSAIVPVESAGSAQDYVGFTGCAVNAGVLPTPECGVVHFFLHRDTTTGVLSWVSLIDGSGTNACNGTVAATFTAAGATLVLADENNEVTSAGFDHRWLNGCADGHVFELDPTGVSITGTIDSGTGLARVAITTDPMTGAEVEIPITGLPSGFSIVGTDGAGTLDSAVFDLGTPRVPATVEFDHVTSGATSGVEVYVRTADAMGDVAGATFVGPFASGASLGSVPAGRFVQYRLELTAPATTSGGAPRVEVTEVRIDTAPCDCVIGGTLCAANGQVNPGDPCLVCDGAQSSTDWSPGNEGGVCDDGDICTTGEMCAAGVCVGGAPLCDDGLACTTDRCNPSTGACGVTISEGCLIGGACVAEDTADPNNVCASCRPTTSATEYSANDDGASCDDGLTCTEVDMCVSGVCEGTGSICNDGLTCTTDTCDEVTGCSATVDTGCAIDGACVEAGALNPVEACQSCDPIRPEQWSVADGCIGCNADVECTAADAGVCDTSTNTCVACVDRDDCAATTPVCDMTQTCVACATDADCPETNASRCAGDGSCIACLEHGDCPAANPICDAGRCGDCSTDERCVARDETAPRCDVASGTCGACSAAADCVGSAAGSICVVQSCGCATDDDCGSDRACLGSVCVPVAGADSDGDGTPDEKDADSDNDGLTDLTEGRGRDFSRDSDLDGVPDAFDADAAGFVDSDGNNTDDRGDADGDGVPNHLDLDSDADGIPDSLENAGRDVLDADRDGRLDELLDVDGDGLVAAADEDDLDADARDSLLTTRDTDDDGTPDVRDLDSDGDGLMDVSEGGGPDEDGDGLLDVRAVPDSDMDGIADAVMPPDGVALPLPDSDGDGAWDFQDVTDDTDWRIRGSTLCSASPASAPGATLVLLFVAGVALKRRHRT